MPRRKRFFLVLAVTLLIPPALTILRLAMPTPEAPTSMIIHDDSTLHLVNR